MVHLGEGVSAEDSTSDAASTIHSSYIMEIKSNADKNDATFTCMLSQSDVTNIRKHSEYLDEVFRIAKSSDNPFHVSLEEKDVGLPVQFLALLIFPRNGLFLRSSHT